MTNTGRRGTMLGVAAAALLPLAPAWAQPYPSKPVKLIAGFAAGGPSDAIARSLARALEEEIRQAVVVENRAGATGIVGLQAVTAAPPDGYTIGLLANTTTTALHFSGKPLDIDGMFTPVCRFVSTRILLVVNPAVMDVRTLAEFVEFLRARPGTNLTSAGHGGLGHLGLELFAMDQKLTITHVAYKGSGPAMVDVLSGQVSAMVVDATSAMPHIQSGRLRAIATVSTTRTPSLPDLPTAIELGYGSLQIDSTMGIILPPRTPQPIVDRLAAALKRVIEGPAYAEAASKAGNARYFNDAAEFRDFLARDFARWGRVIRDAKVKVD